jgi:hypothetical protein
LIFVYKEISFNKNAYTVNKNIKHDIFSPNINLKSNYLNEASEYIIIPSLVNIDKIIKYAREKQEEILIPPPNFHKKIIQ